jgi:hypothetical protein
VHHRLRSDAGRCGNGAVVGDVQPDIHRYPDRIRDDGALSRRNDADIDLVTGHAVVFGGYDGAEQRPIVRGVVGLADAALAGALPDYSRRFVLSYLEVLRVN